MNESMKKFEAYVERLRREGTKLPSHSHHARPNIKVISAASGINRKVLSNPSYKRLLKWAVQEVGIETPQKRTHQREIAFERNRKLITQYIELLQQNGQKLPEDPKHRGQVFFGQAEVESGVTTFALIINGCNELDAYKSQLRELLDRAAIRIGVEIRALPRPLGRTPGSITYEHLLEQGTAQRTCELHNKAGAKQQVYNTRSALNRFRKSLGLEVTTVVGDEFVVRFQDDVATVIEGISSVNSRKKFHTEICWWHDFYRRLIKGNSLPDSLPEALTFLIKNSGISAHMVAKLVGMTCGQLNTWAQGHDTPDAVSCDKLRRIESLFKLPAGSLVNKVPRTVRRFRRSRMPDFLRRNKPLSSRVSRHLPDDFCDLPLERQREIVDGICEEIIHCKKGYGEWMVEMARLPYRLKTWPEQLEQEFNEFCRFKTEGRSPLGMRRNGRWRTSTSKLTREWFSAVFGAVCLPSDAAEARLRGLGVLPECLSLAIIAAPLVIDWYIRFKCETRGQYTESAIKLLQCFRSMLRAETGWLWQRPQLMDRLLALSSNGLDIIPGDVVVKTRSDWSAMCEYARVYYSHLIKEITPLVSVARDPFNSIEGILRKDNPMEALTLLLEGMRGEKPNKYTQPVHYHTAVRNCALVTLLAATGLRRNTLSQLNFTGTDAGHLRLKDNRYILKIPRTLFKEQDSPYFGPKYAKRDYFMELPDAIGLYDTLTEYLTISRPFLLEKYHSGSTETPLFVSSSNCKGIRMSPSCISQLFRSITEKHFSENKARGTGIFGAGRTGPHIVRHVRATTIVKMTGSLQIAADANHHGVAMSERFYVQFLPEDRNRRVNEVLFETKFQ